MNLYSVKIFSLCQSLEVILRAASPAQAKTMVADLHWVKANYGTLVVPTMDCKLLTPDGPAEIIALQVHGGD